MMSAFTLLTGGALAVDLAVAAPGVTASVAGGAAPAVELVRSRSAIFLDLWGKSLSGARSVLQTIESGRFKLVPDLTLEHIEWYRQVAMGKIGSAGDEYGFYMLQALRLQILQKIELMTK
jgi:hypothetical protein